MSLSLFSMTTKAEFLSTTTESSFKPKRGIGSESERMVPQCGNSFFNMSSLMHWVVSLFSSLLQILSSQRYCVMKSVKAFSDQNLTSADFDSIFLTITGSSISMMSFEFAMRILEFLAIDSRIQNRQVLNSSRVLLPYMHSQFSNKKAIN